jgi:hypothetical protein
MGSSQRMEAPPLATGLPGEAPASCRIAMPLGQVLDLARQESESLPCRQMALALRRVLALALTTTGLCRSLPPAAAEVAEDPWCPDAAASPGRGSYPSLRQGREATTSRGEPAGGEPEILFTALSSLVEVVKTLTPSDGKVYAHLGHEAVLGAERGVSGDRGREEAPEARAAPRSEVVIELVSTPSASFEGLTPAILDGLGALAFELAVVAAIVESKGGELYLDSPGGDSRSFVVRLPVRRS